MSILLTAVMMLGILPLGQMVFADDPEVITEVYLTSETVSVSPGPLPAFEVKSDTVGLNEIEAYGASTHNTRWEFQLKGIDRWDSFGLEEPVAVEDGTTRYSMHLSLTTNYHKYVFDENIKVYFNGEDLTTIGNSKIQGFSDSSFNINIDLGTAGAELGRYKLTYDPNGGSGTMKPKDAYEGDEVELPDCQFKPPEGKIFDYWEIDGQKYDPKDKITMDGNKTAVAVWKVSYFIRLSKAKMIPGTIDDSMCANNLYFSSLDQQKYTVSFWRVYDLTDESLNIGSEGPGSNYADMQYPHAYNFVAGHEYAIEFRFDAISPYEYDEAHMETGSLFYLNGVETDISAGTSLSFSKLRRVVLTAQSGEAAAVPKDALYVVTATSLNIRGEAGFSGQRVGGLKFGDVIRTKAECGDWVQLDTESTGWVNRNFVALTYSEETAIDPTECTVTASSLNVREDISTESNRIGGLKQGDVVLVTGIRTDGDGARWLVLDYFGDGEHKLGYILEEFTNGPEVLPDNISLYSLAFFSMPEGDINLTSMPVISRGDTVEVTEDNLTSNDDGTLTVTVFPDDGSNFNNITVADITLPEDSKYVVKDSVLQEDGSLVITFEQRMLKITYDANGGIPGPEWVDSVQIPYGEKTDGIVGVPPESLVKAPEGQEFDGWDIGGTQYHVGEGMEIEYKENTLIKCLWKDLPVEIIYTFVNGADGEWTKGSDSTMDYKITRNIEDDLTFSLFDRIEVDGSVLDPSCYTTTEGSLNASLKSSYLDTLSDGSHVVEIHFEDGSAETELTVKAAPLQSSVTESSTGGTQTVDSETPSKPSVSPATGDFSNVGPFTGLMAGSIAGVGLLLYLLWKRKNDR
ncbi:MAG: InlB B-repeat-containing protein [Oscillospiraceae bacterium]|nr:InlB B-repeat-containing protein [Oscillospiraceae bacterium]